MQSRALVVSLSLLASAIASAATVTRGPYIQNVDGDSAIIAFRLDTWCSAQVRFGDGPEPGLVASSTGSGTEHFVALEGLQPGAAYRYVVEACGSPTGKGGTFQTAPPPGTLQAHFAAMGDFGTGGPNEIQNGNAILAKAPEFWLALGDTAYSYGTDYEFQINFFNPLAPLLAKVPVFPSIGNHEYETSNGAPYFAAFALPTNNPAGSERYYSFDWGPVHVVALDAMCELGRTTASCTAEDQKQWLRDDLAASRAPWKIVMFHHPIYSSGEHLSTKSLHDWIPIFEAGGVDLVLTGHDHNYERTHPMKGVEQVSPPGTPGAITYVVVGNGAAFLRGWAMPQPAWSAVRNNVDYGFLDVAIDGGTLTATALTADGKVIDRFTLEKELGSQPPPTDGGGESGDGGVTAPPADPPRGNPPSRVGCRAAGAWIAPLTALLALLAISRRRAQATRPNPASSR
jgi:hypothetical protein